MGENDDDADAVTALRRTARRCSQHPAFTTGAALMSLTFELLLDAADAERLDEIDEVLRAATAMLRSLGPSAAAHHLSVSSQQRPFGRLA